MKKYLLTTLENSKNYTLAVAEAMPEKGYETRPVDNVWNFRELLSHIGYGIQWWESNYIKGQKVEWQQPEPKATKKEVLDYLNRCYDGLKQTIEASAAGDNIVKGFHTTLDHITHHRGQAVIHLRCNGITPPDYTF